MTTIELINNAGKKDAQAQKKLYDLFTDSLWQICLRYCPHKMDAEEALMNSWLQIFSGISLAHFVHEKQAIAWMRKITVNACLQLLRKSSKLLLVTDDGAAGIADTAKPIDHLAAKEIEELINQLPMGYKTIFTLYAIEGYPHKEIAELLHITEGTSKSQLSKARKMLSDMLYQKTEYYGLEKAR